MTGAPPLTAPQGAPLGGTSPTSLVDAASKGWVKAIATIVNSLRQGKLNASLAVTLAQSATSTTITDARIGASSTLTLQPLTAHAATLYFTSPYVLVSSQQSGQVKLAHASVANTDLNFNLLIIG
jgi:hypothetical protein